MVTRAQPPKTLPGFTAEQSAVILALVGPQHQAIAELGERDASTLIRQATLVARSNQYLRVSPPAAGMALLLPSPKRTAPGDRVTISLEDPAGSLRVACVPNQGEARQVTLGLVNGAERATFTAAGVIELVSNGDTGWTSQTELPAEAAASLALAALEASPPGADGADGEQGIRGAPGRHGEEGRRGFPGAPGQAGRAGSIGPPGRGGDEGRRGMQGLAGMPGAAGAPGIGIPGRRGDEGRRAPIIQGQPGATGATGPAGSGGGGIGPPGRRGDEGRRSFIPGPAGAAGSGGGGAGSAVELATITLGTTPALTGSFTITGLSGLTTNDPVLVQLAVPVADPTESEEQISISGIVTSATVITCYWQSVDGTPKFGSRTVMYAVPTTISSLGNFNPGEQLGLQIDAGGAAAPVKLTPVEQGENIRFDTIQDDSTSTGDLGATPYTIEEPITTVGFGGPGALIVRGITFPAAGGGTAIESDGRLVIARCAVAQVSVTFIHEDTSIASLGQRLSCPMQLDYTMYAGEYVLIYRSAMHGGTTRTRIMPLAVGRGLLKRAIRTSTGAWSSTTPAGTTCMRFVSDGGGGGGGGAAVSALRESGAGAGGGAGAFYDVWVAVVDGAGDPTGSVGNGGNGGTSGGTNGSAGGDTTITYNSVDYVAPGGLGGDGTDTSGTAIAAANQVQYSSPGDGGNTTETDYGQDGAPGYPGLMFTGATTASQMAIGGAGAGSRWGSGARGGRAQGSEATGVPSASNARASGGGGGSRTKNAAAAEVGQAGSNGTAGFSMIEFWSGPPPDTEAS